MEHGTQLERLIGGIGLVYIRRVGGLFAGGAPSLYGKPGARSTGCECGEAGDRLSTEELFATAVLLFIAGHETTANLIGNGVLALLRHPAELQRLREDPTLIQSAVEELLRYDSPVQRVSRIANEDVAIGDRLIPNGSLVLALLGSANRDPVHFAEPDRLDVTRQDNRHLAFGWGIHFCLGAPLARLEGQIAIGTLLRRLPSLTLATEQVE